MIVVLEFESVLTISYLKISTCLNSIKIQNPDNIILNANSKYLI